MECLAATYTPNAKSIFAPLIETNSFHSKPSDQDDAGCKNFPEALQMVRPDDEAISKIIRGIQRLNMKSGVHGILHDVI